MGRFGKQSLAQRATLHPKLQKVLDLAITRIEFVIVEGHRNKAGQDKAYAKGLTKVRWPHGKHNKVISEAADVAPYPLDWSDKSKAIERFVFLQGVIYSCAKELGIEIRQGLDWNSNQDMRDEKFRDYPHVEVVL